jgi:hypothetical protein
MGDLIWACGVLLAVSAGLFAFSVRLAERPSAAGLLAVATTALLVTFVATLHGKLFLAAVIPLSNAIVLGNFLPPLASVLAGVAYGSRKTPRWRRLLMVWVLVAGSWLTVCRDVMVRDPGEWGPWYWEEVVAQSGPATCTASAAATLLRLHGLDATESEMARLCLTRAEGTPRLGLYRGLKRKTTGTRWRIAVVLGSADRLRGLGACPVILPVRSDPSNPRAVGSRDPVHDHCVVLLGFDGKGNAHLLDPSSGHIRWTAAEFEQRYTGEGLRLVLRDP